LTLYDEKGKWKGGKRKWMNPTFDRKYAKWAYFAKRWGEGLWGRTEKEQAEWYG